ncbi:MAG: hypothetical protein IJ151_00275 [Bacteroidales bacterium]|nr:hypothetical protein [Bacteroidales bacterium]
MKKLNVIICGLVLAATVLPAAAQTTDTRESYQERYERMVQKGGASGLGIETLLNRWLADYPDDADALLGKFLYYYSKSQSSQVVAKEQKKFLGQEPVLSLADSLGKVSYYFEELFYDEALFSRALREADKMIRTYPDRIDLRFYKIAALTGYEKENPDQAVAELRGLIDYNAMQHPEWTHPEYQVTDDFFVAAIQEYCVTFYRYGTPASHEAFRVLAQRMLDYYPDNIIFLNDMGSYYFAVKKDEKSALKYYSRVLKLKKDDNTAIRSCILMYRTSKNVKQEKKYLEMMAKYGESESDRKSSQVRLDYLNGKK